MHKPFLKHIKQSIRSKVLFGLSTAAIVATLIFIFLGSRFILESFREVEHNHVVENIKRVHDSFDLQLESLENKFIDWSIWDDAHLYMLDGNVDFENSNFLISQLSQIKFEFFGWRHHAGQWRWAKLIDSDHEQVHEAPESLLSFFDDKISLHLKSDSHTLNEFVDLPHIGPSLITLQKVLPSSGTGESAGVMVAVRALNDSVIQRLSQLTRLDLKLTPLEETAYWDEDQRIYLLDSKLLKVQTIFKNSQQKPIAKVSFELERHIFQEGVNTLILLFSAFFLINIILGAVVWWCLKYFVIDRIALLKDSIDELSVQRVVGKRVPENGSDEIFQLAKATNNFLQELEEAQSEVEKERVKTLQISKLASLGEMSAGIAHEINNPLAIIICSLDVLADNRENPERFQKKIVAIENASKRIKHIVSGLQKFSRSTQKTASQPVFLKKVLEEALQITAVKSQKFNITVESKIDENCCIAAVDIEIEQVFINMINNAIDANRKNAQGWVKIEGHIEGDKVVVRVLDSGQGIPTYVAQRLFEPFFTTKEVNEGAGLGLSIVKGIVNEYEGEIFINDTFPNTCFEIHFPLYREKSVDQSVA